MTPTTAALPDEIERALNEALASSYTLGFYDGELASTKTKKAQQTLTKEKMQTAKATIAAVLAEQQQARELNAYNLAVALETIKAQDAILAELRASSGQRRQADMLDS